MKALNLIESCNLQEDKVLHWALDVERQHLMNPFHDHRHAADVLQTVLSILLQVSAGLTSVSQAAIQALACRACFHSLCFHSKLLRSTAHACDSDTLRRAAHRSLPSLCVRMPGTGCVTPTAHNMTDMTWLH